MGKVTILEARRRFPRDTSKTIVRQWIDLLASPAFASFAHRWTADKRGHADQRCREHARRGRRKRKR